ncbi:TlpA family protein disulfide reductase [Hymenobacter sp. 5317J-9]|uniref:TlpA family protein disulfide reductase n=1 Tax=Hymenobacter sp. 5317J-9 TaxID=2932250 RepID=UPI001FD63BC5|nr:TlpA disulfide reductase family protein [Hymenobacter sp. 5317J-9]UOQ99458.1 TlpA family protein disulfide reductase [Hymenobacter sp. 5317J-9]
MNNVVPILALLWVVGIGQLPGQGILPKYGTPAPAVLASEKLLNLPVPAVRGRTLTGRMVDAAYFKGRVTLLNFMYLGCQPCMAELPLLKRVSQQYAGRVQVLSVVPHPAARLRRFNGTGNAAEARLRKSLGVGPITHELLPECGEIQAGALTTFGPECEDIAHRFLVDGYPCSFLIDRRGVIRYVFNGFPTAPPYLAKQEQTITAAINKLVAEK